MLSCGIWFCVENKKKEGNKRKRKRKKERKKTETHPKTKLNGRNNKKFYQTINGHLNVQLDTITCILVIFKLET